jgi:hypothetical protein
MEPRATLAQLLTAPGPTAPAIVVPSLAVVVSYKALAEQVERRHTAHLPGAHPVSPLLSCHVVRYRSPRLWHASRGCGLRL